MFCHRSQLLLSGGGGRVNANTNTQNQEIKPLVLDAVLVCLSEDTPRFSLHSTLFATPVEPNVPFLTKFAVEEFWYCALIVLQVPSFSGFTGCPPPIPIEFSACYKIVNKFLCLWSIDVWHMAEKCCTDSFTDNIYYLEFQVIKQLLFWNAWW